MKRSEALEEIRKILAMNGKDNGYGELEKAILHHLEFLGMLPPGYMKPIEFFEGKQYPLIPGDFKNEEGIWCTPGFREWEPEDE